MSREYLDKRRDDRLGLRSITFRKKELVSKLDAYCLLTNTKIIDYVEDAVITKLNYDISKIQNKGEDKNEQMYIKWESR